MQRHFNRDKADEGVTRWCSPMLLLSLNNVKGDDCSLGTNLSYFKRFICL